MQDNTDRTLFVAIVPSQGSAYYLDGEDLVQTPLDDGYAFVAGPRVTDPDDGGGAVDWDRGFTTPAEAEPVRQVERVLRCLPGDATAPASDPILISRSDLSELLAAIGSARVRASDAYYAEADTFNQAKEFSAADEHQYLGRRMKKNGDDLLGASGVITVTDNPQAHLAELMPKVRWRDVDTTQP
jgi:hypothetical protein